MVINCGPAETLSNVLLLLYLEDVLVEVELQLLVGKVDAQLLKPIHFKVLKMNAREQVNSTVQPVLIVQHQGKEHNEQIGKAHFKYMCS